MVKEAIALTQTAINRLAIAVELPELIQLSSQYEVREYALELIGTVNRRCKEIDNQIESALVEWQLNRLPRIDRDILRIAVAEMLYLDIPQKVAINEAVEIAKRYSDEDGYRFINGVLRRVSDRLKAEAKQSI
jgi:N utilization substance protein B